MYSQRSYYQEQAQPLETKDYQVESDRSFYSHVRFGFTKDKLKPSGTLYRSVFSVVHVWYAEANSSAQPSLRRSLLCPLRLPAATASTAATVCNLFRIISTYCSMGSNEKDVAKPAEQETPGQKRKVPEDAKITSFFKTGDKNEVISKSKDKKEEEEDDEEEDDEDEEDEEDEEEDDSEEEDMAPKKKKRRTRHSDDSEDSGDESEPELKMTEDDLVGVDTTNIIPRSRRRAAVAAMALASKEIAAATGDVPPVAAAAANGGDDDDDGESSDEAEF
ncbi:hypothetical protein KXD40_007343 [Peronospora effusa]|uniref:Histone chaperone domain-containing protein n=1 Tax=Peronospora effusa TaxID=542832 RepID=A0A3M6VBS9_9STRA|nr:hypothetical protein DD238_005922 [Peronospora effusa]RQM12970.1 hypothetical protein DD237_006900 [Peronospora effusa]UIZ28905.1 hypothetical protein KXD40_007343 [Peronospora effusa]